MCESVGLVTLASDMGQDICICTYVHTYVCTVCLGNVTHESASNGFYVGNIAIFIDAWVMGYPFNIYVLFSRGFFCFICYESCT